MKIPDRASLERRRPVIIADLLAKVEAEDWHGVADAAMDLREIDAQLQLLAGVVHRHRFVYDGPSDAMLCACGERLSAEDWAKAFNAGWAKEGLTAKT